MNNLPENNMNKKVSAIIVLILVLVVGGYLIMRNNQKSGEITNPQAETANWKTYTNTADGFSFHYPEKVSAKYVFAQAWPPEVKVTTGVFACNLKFCSESQSEGAAGTTYTTYTYKTSLNGKLITYNFVLGYPQCANYYDTPNMAECQKEQKDFNLDNLMSTMISTFKFLPVSVSTPVTCSTTEHSCPCATGNYCLFRGAMCLNPASACPISN